MHKDCLVTKASKIKLLLLKGFICRNYQRWYTLEICYPCKTVLKMLDLLHSCLLQPFFFFFFLLLCDIYLLGIFWISYIIGSKQDDNRYSHCSTRPMPWQMPYMLILTKLWIETALVRAFVKIAGERFLYLSHLISSLLTPDKMEDSSTKFYWRYPVKGLNTGKWQLVP